MATVPSRELMTQHLRQIRVQCTTIQATWELIGPSTSVRMPVESDFQRLAGQRLRWLLAAAGSTQVGRLHDLASAIQLSGRGSRTQDRREDTRTAEHGGRPSQRSVAGPLALRRDCKCCNARRQLPASGEAPGLRGQTCQLRFQSPLPRRSLRTLWRPTSCQSHPRE